MSVPVQERLRRGAAGAGRRLRAAGRVLVRGSDRAGMDGSPWEATGREVAPDLLQRDPVSRLLYDRLDADDVAEVVARLEGPDVDAWAASDQWGRVALALAFGVHYGVPAVLEKTGLSPAQPPQEVHAMGRGSLSAGGAYYYGDLIVDALEGAGVALEPGWRGLDFGCSSGRVARVLAAAHPEIEWHGCDPIPSSIEWAREHLPAIDFSVSPEEPPLPYPEGHFDLAFAISIWSHYGPEAAQTWLEELRRVVRPAGHLLLTTHGWNAVAFFAPLRPRRQLEEIAAALYERGFWFAPEFGAAGDHGIVNPEWGTAFMTAEWLLSRAEPAWRLVNFAAGRVEANQDMYLLQRV